jgi:Fe-S-cluster containining protein
VEQGDELKETILNEYPRLSLSDKFEFSCHPGVPCFNKCCADINIVLTPYDIIRLKNRFRISSQEFLQKYTVSPFTKKQRLPAVLIKMNDDAEKACPFVSKKGCTVYEDRPWPCRMYPIGQASGKTSDNAEGEEFYFLLKEDICKGHNEKKKITIGEWIKDQGIDEYDRMGSLFKEISLHKYFREGKDLEPQAMEMYHTVCYNLDKFRNFIFKSSFLDKFEVDKNTLEQIEKDDIELMKFGFTWLRFCLFKEKTMTIRSDVAESKKKELLGKKKQG